MAALSVVPTPNERREGKPLRSLTRHERRRARMVVRRGQAVHPLALFSVAVDYLRSVAADDSLVYIERERALRHAAQVVESIADQLAATRRIR